MVVPHPYTGNAGEDVEELVSISVGHVVTDRLLHIDREVSLLVARNLTISFDVCQSGWTWEGCLHVWSIWLIRESHGRGGESLISGHGAHGRRSIKEALLGRYVVLELREKELLHFCVKLAGLLSTILLLL